MHYARLENSPRLQRLLAVLRQGGWYSTRDLVKQAEVMAINSAADELRANGFEITCERRGKYWYYRLQQPVQFELVVRDL